MAGEPFPSDMFATDGCQHDKCSSTGFFTGERSNSRRKARFAWRVWP